jgi:hypothetical protein
MAMTAARSREADGVLMISHVTHRLAERTTGGPETTRRTAEHRGG